MDSSKYTRNIAEQLSQLRDLLIVIERSNDAPDVLYKIAIEKSQHITSLVEEWRAEVDPVPVEIPAEYASWLENDTETEPEDSDINHIADVVDLHPLAIEPDEAVAEEELLDVVAHVPTDDVQPDAVPQESTVEEEYVAPFVEDDVYTDDMPSDTDEEPGYNEEADDVLPVDSPSDEVYTDEEPTLDNDIINDDNEAYDDVVVVDYDVVASDNLVEEYDDDDDDFSDDDDDDDDEGDDIEVLLEQELAIDEFYNRGEPFDNDTITVGEMMSVRQAKELRKALSLNDRFRFRRELFGNSDVTMNDTLNLIDTMNDYNEALEYLTQDLEWSPEEPVVQEFLQLVERHFKKQ